MIFAFGFTGQGPTCGNAGSSTGAVNDATWFHGETDAGSGFLDSASTYNHGIYNASAPYTMTDNWANAAATGPSGDGYIVIALKAAPVTGACGTTRLLLGVGC
jgi:hypothetical protein